MKSYLDELLYDDADPPSAESKARVMETASTRYFPQSIDFSGDIQIAFELWDAVFDGVQNGDHAVPKASRKLWSETNAWLAAWR